MQYREATTRDAAAIAGLHADSWRRHYRGAFLDSYLDGDILTDRVAEWTGRLAQAGPDRYTVAGFLDDGTMAGFAHTFLDADPVWGAFLDNLHVRYDLKRQGIGARLLAETTRTVLRRRPSSGLYLWVLEQNTAAQAFYQAQGGHPVERELAGPFPGGGRAYALRYAWRDLSRPRQISEIADLSDSPVKPKSMSRQGVAPGVPALVEAAARGLAASNLTILNGTQGVNEVVTGLVGQGLSILDTLKKSTAIPGHGAFPVPLSETPGGHDRADAT